MCANSQSDPTKECFQRFCVFTFSPMYFFFRFSCLGKLLSIFVVWHVCRANEGYIQYTVRARFDVADDQTPKFNCKERKNTYKIQKNENIPIGIKVCTIHFNPWHDWNRFALQTPTFACLSIDDRTKRLTVHIFSTTNQPTNQQQQ